jgi:hypothetical protein
MSSSATWVFPFLERVRQRLFATVSIPTALPEQMIEGFLRFRHFAGPAGNLRRRGELPSHVRRWIFARAGSSAEQAHFAQGLLGCSWIPNSGAGQLGKSPETPRDQLRQS